MISKDYECQVEYMGIIHECNFSVYSVGGIVISIIIGKCTNYWTDQDEKGGIHPMEEETEFFSFSEDVKDQMKEELERQFTEDKLNFQVAIEQEFAGIGG